MAFLLLHVCCYTYTQVTSSYVHLPAHYSCMLPLNPQSFLVIHVSKQKVPTACYGFIALLWCPPVDYLQITEPGHQETVTKRRSSRNPPSFLTIVNSLQISGPRLMFSAIMSKPVKKVWVQNEMDVETYNTTNIFNSTLQFMKHFFLFWWQFMTWNIAPKFLFKVKSELWKLKMGCNKLARNSLRPANFTSPHFHERRWQSWWTHERLHLHVIICLNCSCPWKLFWQANRKRALSIN